MQDLVQKLPQVALSVVHALGAKVAQHAARDGARELLNVPNARVLRRTARLNKEITHRIADLLRLYIHTNAKCNEFI